MYLSLIHAITCFYISNLDRYEESNAITFILVCFCLIVNCSVFDGHCLFWIHLYYRLHFRGFKLNADKNENNLSILLENLIHFISFTISAIVIIFLLTALSNASNTEYIESLIHAMYIIFAIISWFMSIFFSVIGILLACYLDPSKILDSNKKLKYSREAENSAMRLTISSICFAILCLMEAVISVIFISSHNQGM